MNGPLLFASYAFPPNQHGYCGPDEWDLLLAAANAGDAAEVDGDIRRLGRAFDGALPYLELIAETTGIGDPFDPRVVRAYWVGGPLLDSVPLLDFGNSLRERFHGRMGSSWVDFTDLLTSRSVPHHSFHVLMVYPWVGLLRSGNVEVSLKVLDRCRIRTGEVLDVFDEFAAIRFRPLVWEDECLRLGDHQVEVARVSGIHGSLAQDIGKGDQVALHWDWVCDRITDREASAINGYLVRHMRDVNRKVDDDVNEPADWRRAGLVPADA